MQSLPKVSRRQLLVTGAGLSLGPLAPAAGAQTFPDRPVRIILGFSAGGSGDLLARSIAPVVSRELGQPFVIENRPGAASNIASVYVAKAPADGYTLLLGGNFSHAVNPALFGAALTFDPIRDFVPVAQVSDSAGMVIVVPSSLSVSTLREFLDYARKAGPAVNFASSGPGSPGHIAGGYLNQRAGLSMTHVPYRGSSDAMKDVVTGLIQLTITAPTAVLPFVKDGRLKALALTVPTRSPQMPDVPGSTEAGLADFNIDGWYGVFAPAGTPAAVVSKLNAAFTAAMVDPETRQRIESLGLPPAPAMSADKFARFVKAELKRWEPIVKASGATIG